MATAAGEVEGDLRERGRAILAELANLVGINGHQVGADIAGEHLGVACGALGDAGHMAVDALSYSWVNQRILVLRLAEVAVFALRPGRLY